MILPDNLGPENGENGMHGYTPEYPLLVEEIECNLVNIYRHLFVISKCTLAAPHSSETFDTYAEKEISRSAAKYASSKLVIAYAQTSCDRAVTSNTGVL